MASRNSAAACAARSRYACDSAAVSRDLPIPGSPETSTTRPSPSFACCQRRSNRSSSSSRPTSGVDCGAKRLEAAQNAALADHAPGALRFSKTGKWLRPEILQLEQRTDLPSRAIGNDERARCGQSLQPGGQVRRLADNPALLRGARTDQIADHD